MNDFFYLRGFDRIQDYVHFIGSGLRTFSENLAPVHFAISLKYREESSCCRLVTATLQVRLRW